MQKQDTQYNNPSIRIIGGKQKLTKDAVKEDVEIFLQAINENQNENFSDIWLRYNNNANYPHRSGMHAGHIVFPTYTGTDHPILCNTMPDSLLLEQIVCDAELMQKYCEIYKYFHKQTKPDTNEWMFWVSKCQHFFIDAFKVLLAGHYMAHNIVCLEMLSEKNGGTYKYQHGVYNITWKKGTIKKTPYKEFLNTLREIDKNEDMLKVMQKYLVENNKPGSYWKNHSFAIAVKYFIDELLNANKLRKQNQQPTYNFNMVFDALVCAEINAKNGLGAKEQLFLDYLQEYQMNYPNIPNNNIYDAANAIINNGYNSEINCIDGKNNNIPQLNLTQTVVNQKFYNQ